MSSFHKAYFINYTFPLLCSLQKQMLKMPIKNYLTFIVCKGDGIWQNIQERIRQRGKSAIITDIIDGKYYKRLCEAGQFLNRPSNISFIFNTDGAPLYSSSGVSLWPVFLAINELPSPDRYEFYL